MESSSGLYRSSSQQSFDARQQLRCLKGLGHIVVAAEFESDDLVYRFITCSQKQYRSRQSCLADIATQIQSAAKWQHHIKDEEIERRGIDSLHTLITIFRGRHDITFSAQTIAQRRP